MKTWFKQGDVNAIDFILKQFVCECLEPWKCISFFAFPSFCELLIYEILVAGTLFPTYLEMNSSKVKVSFTKAFCGDVLLLVFIANDLC